jgi:holliday junction DNA helicase RuvA
VIALLSGILDSVGPEGAIVDVGGVGYLAFCSGRTLGRLPPPGGAVRLLIETHVREDHIHLYGFVDAAERDWFRLLTTVQGVGARLALSILSAAAPDALLLAIAAQDKAALTRADGVGARLAARVVNELRDKVGGLGATGPGSGGLAPAPSVGQTLGGPQPGLAGTIADAVSALEHLKIGRAEAYGAITAAARRLGDDAAVEALITAGLQELGQGSSKRANR